VRSRWVALAVIFLTRLSMGFQFQSVASVGPFLLDEFRLSHAQLGGLMGLYLLPGAAVAPVFFAAAVMAATVPALWWFRRTQVAAGV
jgi:hypothetical protein